jgi:conjugative relaxase-like TrwC/TraI family protein
MARAKYYMDLAREDYYIAGGEPPGKWYGKGAEYLGLEGRTVKRAQFASLFKGYSPVTGAQLVQNAGQDRQALWDLTFSAPKSVSVAWSQASQEVRLAIQAAHEDAVKAALAQLEEHYGWTRRGEGGEMLERVHIVSALFEHGTSRAQDPQLHTHALLFNIGVRNDQSTGTLFIRPVFVAKMVLGALYRVEFSKLLEQRLGFVCEKGPQQTFELKGRNPKLCSFFSKRSHELHAEMDRTGASGAAAAQKATLKTRTTKRHEPREKLFETWRAIGRDWGWSEDQVRKSQFRAKERDPGKERAMVLDTAIARLMHDTTHFNENALIRAVAEEAQTRGLGAKECMNIAQEALSSKRLQALGNGFFTTQECLQMEKELLSQVETTRNDKAHAINPRAVEKKLKRAKDLSEEQKSAVRHITAKEGGISVLCGMAGTGKSRLLKIARELWEKEGYVVYGAAFTGKAARELQTSSGIQSRTITKAQMLIDSKWPLYWGKKYIAPKAPEWSPLHDVAVPCLRIRKEYLRLTPKSILVVDEAGMVPTPQMKALIDSAAKAGAKVVLVGDSKQLQAIGQGGAFTSIAKRLGAATLTEIKRQTLTWGRELVHHFAKGEAAQALAKAQELGLLHVTATRDDAKTTLIKDWKAKGISRPDQNLILAGTRADAAVLNLLAQEERIKARTLGSKSFKRGKERIYAGDRVLFTKNSTRLGVQNGTLATVEKIDRTFLTARLDAGETVKIPLARYKDFQLGYAVTTHKAQGMTTKNTFVLLDARMQDLHLSYVEASRAQLSTSFYVDKPTAGKNLEKITHTMSQSHEKRLATDLLEENLEKENLKKREQEDRRREEEDRRRHQQEREPSQSQSL